MRLVADDQPTEDLPDLAADALAHGLDSPALRQLAGTSRSDVRDARDLFLHAVEELGLEVPSIDTALHAMAKAWAEDMLHGRLAPRQAAGLIWSKASSALGHPTDLVSFVALADEWDDNPEAREEIERLMLNEAASLVAAHPK
jgi:hypothetical protein